MNTRIHFRASGAGLLLLALPAVLAGCGHSTTVSGRVTYAGRPVTYGSVTFVDFARAAHSAAISRDGSYAIDGLAPGAASIEVISRDPSKGRSVLRNRKPVAASLPGSVAAAQPASGWFPLPAKFESVTTSGLGCTLEAGSMTHDIELK